MEQLDLTQDLYNNITSWMVSKYSLTTQRQRQYNLKRIFKKYGVLNQETLRKMMKTFRHQHQRACIVMILDYCYDQNINFNLKIPSIKKQASKLPQILSSSEIDLMIKSAPKPYDLAIRCIFNMGAGLRISEIIKFSWDHIRWVDWLSNQEDYGVAVIKAGKGSKDRIVNIPKKLMKDLYQYALETNNFNEFRVPMGGAIFPFGSFKSKKENHMKELFNSNQEMWKVEYIQSKYDWFRYNILELCCEKALNKRIKIHSLRHSRATYLYEIEGVPVEKIQILLGHSSLNTTMLYTRVNPRSVFELLKNTKEI